ncbi:MAG: YifB family Mg chelatase-like AAA ATPase [Butyrivibrio sp.]|nr:YifB family Mg chelatase-like AAA ATPase [Butyrivibrio sp.]
MFSSVTSGAAQGIAPYLMQVEVDVSDGLPCFNMVGFMSSEVKEAAERVKVALRNAGQKLPPARITVNLSPVDIRKTGVVVDLPIAVGVMISLGVIDQKSLEKTVVLGELSLDGEVKNIKGVLPVVARAREMGFRCVILPKGNAREGAVVEGINVIGVSSLQEAAVYLNAPFDERERLIPPMKVDAKKLLEEEDYSDENLDFSDINGQAGVKRAAEIAAAGFHHLMLIGPPGAGKSMVAKRIPTILPPLSLDESLEVSTIYSVAGMLGEGKALITKRPFMSTHHLVTDAALVGGGTTPRPGLISLAHRGVLFLDEMPEFPRGKLDLLREPLEDRHVHIVRNMGTITYPASFQLVGALNPCPCGYYPDRNRCKCTPNEIRRYLSHISGPILDRVDICVEAPRIDIADLAVRGGENINETSAVIRERVLRARKVQEDRFKGTDIRFNSEMTPKDIEKYCALGGRESAYLEQVFCSMELSARSYHKILRVARTIADLDGSLDIRQIHLMEAVGYRITDGKYWSQTEE